MDALLEAAASPNAQIRLPAQATLEQMLANNLAQYLGGLCTELANAERAVPIRQQAGIQLKNLVASKDEARRQELGSRWLTLDASVRNHVRQLLVKTLADGNKDVRSTAALAIGKIAGIEIPANMWLDLIKDLSVNIESGDNNLKEASFQALGYVCEECAAYLQAQSNVVLTLIARGMHKDQAITSIKLAATTALANCLDFVKQNFKLPNDRNMIMAMIFSVAISEDLQVRVKAYECLVEIAATYYEYLPQYIRELFHLTGTAIQKEQEPVVLQAVEFWTTIADEERARAEDIKDAPQESAAIPFHNFTKLALPQLMPLILNLLTKQVENVEDDTWNSAMAAGMCLGSMAQAVSDEIIPHVLPFIEANIANPDWRFREASILSFGYILDGPSAKGMATLVKKAFPFLLKYMRDPNIHVKDTAAWTIGRVCDILPRTIEENMLPQLMEALLHGLRESPKVAGNVCWALHNLADAVDLQPDALTSPLSRYFEGLIGGLMAATERNDVDEHNLLLSSYETINVMISSAAPDMYNFINSLIPKFAAKLQTTLAQSQQANADASAAYDLQNYLCSVLQCIIQRLPEEAIKPHATNFMKLFLAVMGLRQHTLSEEALMAVGALANKVGKDFEPSMSVFAPFLLNGLTNWKEYQTCAVAVGVVGDISRALEEKLAPFCDRIMQVLLGNLANPNMERSVKPSIIACLGDIALAIGGNFDRYMPYVMMMLSQASSIKLDPSVGDNAEYMRTLRENILSAYTSIIQGLNSDHKAALFGNFLGGVVPFLEIIAADAITDDDVVKAAVGLIGDMIQRIGASIKGSLMNESVRKLVASAAASKDEKLRSTGTWANLLFQQLQRA